MNERRTAWLLVLILLGQLALLAAQVPAEASQGSYLERWVVRAVAPLPRLVAVVARKLGRLRADLRRHRVLLEENRDLKAENRELRRQLLGLRNLEGQVEDLSAAMRYSREADRPLVVADVVYADYSSLFRTLVLYVGSRRIRPNQPVVAEEGLVGRVTLVSGPYAKVQLVTDRSAAVGAMIERTRRQGIVRGSPGGALELEYLPLSAEVLVGDPVVTAGNDGVYPRGIPLGTVTSVEPGTELFHQIRLAPAVDFGHLDQVYILDREPLPDEIKEALPGASP